ncbi:uncharacterized protein A1O9_01410 [Exophiala aquamarina CBS 119918]|uniref:Secreted protein n=1 Tax=Exophiala aquamarina CBS 119918 TaxID=1182545 RepID=A0A072PUL1_9EURO|nr:uncharacterized protein A1O9_01410 [Exophiala aquamarina CBS 119918]KEF63432.1 hypothetical protein A1O9_01410 [Exophiala aquamarina CBS 119918]
MAAMETLACLLFHPCVLWHDQFWHQRHFTWLWSAGERVWGIHRSADLFDLCHWAGDGDGMLHYYTVGCQVRKTTGLVGLYDNQFCVQYLGCFRQKLSFVVSSTLSRQLGRWCQ